MNASEAKKILDKVIGQIFGYQNPLSLEQAMEKFAFDVRLPQQVYDSTDGSQTWASSTNPTKFIKMENARKNQDDGTNGMYAKEPINNLQELLQKWNAINLTTTERQIDSLNVAETLMYLLIRSSLANREIMAANTLTQEAVFDETHNVISMLKELAESKANKYQKAALAA